MRDIKPIHNETDHKAALAEIDRLWDAEPGTPKGQRLEVLVILVEAYERKNHPIPPPDPVEAIRFRLEQRGLERGALQDILKCTRGRVSEILARRRPLTLPMMRALRKELDIPAETLLAAATVSPPAKGRPAISLKKAARGAARPSRTAHARSR